MNRMTLTRRDSLAALAACAGGAAAQASWPQRPLKLLVGFPAGSSTDLMARTLADPLGRALGQSVLVDNRGGAGGALSTAQLAKANDEHTIGLLSTGPLTTAKLLNPSLPYDPDRDLAPITLVGTAPLVLVSAPQLKAASVAELLALVRAMGDKANYASVGVGSVAHLAMELLKSRTGIQAQHVPFAGAPAILTAIKAGEIHLALFVPASAMPHAQAGWMKAWAVSAATRSPLVPELPALGDSVAGGFVFEAWNAVCAPARMQAAHRERLARELQAIIRAEPMRQALTRQGWQVHGTSPEALAIRIREERAAMAKLIRERNIKLG
jgi:tripartite-type tricarboxylate transporter receptor subunit TctC